MIEAIFSQLGVDYVIHHTAHVNEERKFISNIRDLRDFFVSLRDFDDMVVDYCLKNDKTWIGFKEPENLFEWTQMTQEQKLTSLINLDPSIPNLDDMFLHILAADESFKNPNAFIIRFEEWIGARGNGDGILQMKTVKAVLEWCNDTASDNDIENALNNFWGKGYTFREGKKIGRWRDEFTPAQVELFKENWGEYIIKWGYEVDNNWNL